jgi:N-terminal domain of reverse transcriptase
MTEEPQAGSTGAPFHGVSDWHAIDWKSAHRTVRRLQARIVKAPEAKEMGQGQHLAPPLNPFV